MIEPWFDNALTVQALLLVLCLLMVVFKFFRPAVERPRGLLRVRELLVGAIPAACCVLELKKGCLAFTIGLGLAPQVLRGLFYDVAPRRP